MIMKKIRQKIYFKNENFFSAKNVECTKSIKTKRKKVPKVLCLERFKVFFKLTELKRGCLYGKDRYNFVKSKNRKTRFCRNLNEFNKKKFDKIVNEIIKRSFSYLERGNSKRS